MASLPTADPQRIEFEKTVLKQDASLHDQWETLMKENQFLQENVETIQMPEDLKKNLLNIMNQNLENY